MSWRFQSSPVANDGCNEIPPSRIRTPRCFNPHPSRTTGATPGGDMDSGHSGVSILTRRERRVQLGLRGPLPSETGFNPHPSRTTGATAWLGCGAVAEEVSILTRRERRVQLRHLAHHLAPSLVSILTRRERRVQQRHSSTWSIRPSFQSSPVANDGCNPIADSRDVRFCVSILTRRERRVQPPTCSRPARSSRFQSSPVANDGCNDRILDPGPEGTMFQSSPVANDGCNTGV